jgi:hypothetical protein
MMRTAARLTLRLYRFELAAILVYGLLLAALGALVAFRLNSAYPGTECMSLWQGAPAVAGCESTVDFLDINEGEAGKVMAAMWLLPVVAGVLAGSVLVSREIEHRTTQFAWSVGTSRRRWFLDRVIPVMLVAVGAVVLAAVTADVLEGARVPWLSARASGQDYGLRGPVVAALAVMAFGVSVLVGSLVGRMLPALILAAALVVGIRAVVSGAVPFGEPVTVLQDSWSSIVTSDNPLYTGSAWQSADGRVLSFDEANALAPTGPGQGDPGMWLSEHGTFVALGVRGPDVWRVELRESGVLVPIGLVGLVLAGFVVNRRRPY